MRLYSDKISHRAKFTIFVTDARARRPYTLAIKIFNSYRRRVIELFTRNISICITFIMRGLIIAGYSTSRVRSPYATSKSDEERRRYASFASSRARKMTSTRSRPSITVPVARPRSSSANPHVLANIPTTRRKREKEKAARNEKREDK